MRRYAFVFAVVALLVAGAASAQNPTGILTGNVTDGQAPLPGVTITVSSPNLQGERTGVTNENGDYVLKLLPPGEYKVLFTLDGFQTIDTVVKISAAQTTTLSAEMPQATIAEEITVTGSIETISTATQAATTFTKDVIEKLPAGRNIEAAVLLTPGTNNNAPRNAISISGAISNENLWTLNGVVLNENVRGQALPLYIEDAVQETTTQTGGISAEYGRFAGGVINVLTKSGGNNFSGSLRVNVTNQSWDGETPLTASQIDKNNYIYEGTLGGRILRDRLWFFAAARPSEVSNNTQTNYTAIPFTQSTEELRLEGKLTWSISNDHRIVGTYFERERDEVNNRFTTNILDLRSLDDRSNPEDLLAVNYSGALSDNFLVEAQYSQRHYTFVGSGSSYTDLIDGTLMLDRSRSSARFWSPTFCGVCDDEKRDNENYLLKASWFLSTPTLGSHDLVLGADVFNDYRFANNHQSGSDYRIYVTRTILDGTNVYPVFTTGTSTYVQYNPIYQSSQTTDFETQSLFFNDRWRLNNHFTFNIGVRYDKNNGQDADGVTVTDDSRISPRIGVTYDPKGDGDWLLSAYYGDYVAAIASGVADNGVGGNPAQFQYYFRNYGATAINAGCTAGNPASCLTTDQALAQFWDWFFNSYGGPDNLANLRGTPYIPGLTLEDAKGLASPYSEEWMLSATKRLGSRGVVRLDYTDRSFHDFYVTRTDMSTGQVDSGLPAPNEQFDLSVLENDNELLERTYQGLSLSFQYRPADRFQFGLGYTWSETQGNVVGENTGSGPVATGVRDYPEYIEMRWYAPMGYLSIDQRHKGAAWLSWDAISSTHHRLNLSLLQRYGTGTPYGAVGAVDPTPYVDNPGYLVPDEARTYYYTARDAYRTDTVTSTDIALNYSFILKAFGADLELFLQPEVFNVFNEDAVVAPNASVSDPTSSSNFAAFNPFTDTPRECPQGTSGADCKAGGYNWQKGVNFGKPTAESSYQTPRTVRVSFGIRF